MQKIFLASISVLTLTVFTISTIGCSNSDVAFAQGAGNPAIANSGSAISIDPALVGRWVNETEGNESSMDLLKDGTGFRGGFMGNRNWNPEIMTWRAEGDRFYIFQLSGGSAQTHMHDYRISGNTLTITNHHGTTTYTRWSE